MLTSIIIQRIFLALTLILLMPSSYSQANSCDEIDKDLSQAASKIFPYYHLNYDSLEYYSNLFSAKINNYVSKNPATLYCPFKMLTDSSGCDVITSPDGLFRIYSWDTWLGGTMHKYRDIYQYKSGNKIFTTDMGYDEDDFGTSVTGIYLLKAGNNTYYLVVGGGSYSTKDQYESIQVYTVEGDSLNTAVPLIKTSEGITSGINVDYDFFSVVDRPERPIRLIWYDPETKIIYIPVVLEGGKVTNRYILYQFKGKYFEHKKTQ